MQAVCIFGLSFSASARLLILHVAHYLASISLTAKTFADFSLIARSIATPPVNFAQNKKQNLPNGNSARAIQLESDKMPADKWAFKPSAFQGNSWPQQPPASHSNRLMSCWRLAIYAHGK